MLQKKGFTLIELVMIIVILAILALVALPYYYNLSSDANTSSEGGVVGGVRAGIATWFANTKSFPTTLDGASNGACTTSNACFVTVLGQGGVTSQWTRVAATQYTGPTTTTYTYVPATGSFQ